MLDPMSHDQALSHSAPRYRLELLTGVSSTNSSMHFEKTRVVAGSEVNSPQRGDSPRSSRHRRACLPAIWQCPE